MKTRLFALVCVVVMFVSFGCRRPDNSVKEEQIEISDITADAEAWADSVCATLDTRSKIAQLFMPALYSKNDYWTVKQVREYMDSCVGGILLLRGDTLSAKALIDSMRLDAKVLPFIAIDAEWGLGMRLSDAPSFPANSAISPSADDQLMYDYGREVARECRQLGINMVMGPVVDVSGPYSFMLKRSFGNDPKRVADLALAYARGLEDGDVISVAKHFPGHGSVSVDSHKRKGIIDRSLNEMDSIDLYPFRKWIEQRLSAIMVGHLAVPSIDSQMLPAAVSPTVITDLLRDDLGFNGLIITDAINMKGAEGYNALNAIKAGADIIIAPVNTIKEINGIAEAVDKGEISIQEIDRHVKKILFYKYLLGLNSKDTFYREKKEKIYSEEADSLSNLLRRR